MEKIHETSSTHFKKIKQLLKKDYKNGEEKLNNNKSNLTDIDLNKLEMIKYKMQYNNNKKDSSSSSSSSSKK